MVIKPEYLPGASPLDQEEMKGLIPQNLANQNQLNVLEKQNIFSAQRWSEQTNRNIFDEAFAKKLHHKMFSEVWQWAGIYRKTHRDLGVLPEQIAEQMRTLLYDVRVWIKEGKYTWPQILSLFHYYLVFIQPFPNGNGRFARLYTECLARAYNQKLPTWGEVKYGSDLNANNPARHHYISALKKADDKKLRDLFDFIYS